MVGNIRGKISVMAGAVALVTLFACTNPLMVDFLARGDNSAPAELKIAMDYLLTKSIADNKTPAEIIGEMVREKIAVSA